MKRYSLTVSLGLLAFSHCTAAQDVPERPPGLPLPPVFFLPAPLPPAPPQVSESSATAQSSSRATSTSEASNVVTIEANRQRFPVASAWAPGLAAVNGTCHGSSSAGAQGTAVGLSFGTTWRDEGCDRRYNSIRLQELGNTAAAIALMCQDAAVAQAMRTAGTPCPSESSSAHGACLDPTGRPYADPLVVARACPELRRAVK